MKDRQQTSKSDTRRINETEALPLAEVPSIDEPNCNERPIMTDQLAQACTTKPSNDFEYYTNIVYWNDFEVVREHFNRTISGDQTISWPQYLKAKYGVFERAFSINCGNGWVERDLFKVGLIREVLGMDFSEKSIADAIVAARDLGIPATYWVGDCNVYEPSGTTVDLVVNHAAMHHVAYVNRLTHQVANMLGRSGRYVAFDYVGAHRNQYPAEMWSAMVEFNESLPPRYQATLDYPHIASMINTDPTEAIHSELQVDVMKRYFDIEEYAPLGGAIAYHILYQNSILFRERHTTEGAEAVNRILQADRAFSTKNPGSELFAFWIAAPKRTSLPSPIEIEAWQKEENSREVDAARNGGRYYPRTGMEIMCDRWRGQPLSLLNGQAGDKSGEPLGEQISTSLNMEEKFRTELECARIRIAMLENSTSGRVTRPLRALKDVINSAGVGR